MKRFVAVALLAALTTTSSISRAAPWAVQLGAFPDGEAAQAKADELREAGSQHVFIEAGADFQRVNVGPFHYFSEAQLIKDDLRASGHAEAFLRDLSASQIGKTPLNENAYGEMMQPFFRPLSPDARESQPANLKDNAEYQRLEAVDDGGDKAAYEQALREALPTIAAADPLKGYIHVNLGICEIIRENYDAALGHLEPVASGEVPSAMAHYIMALNRVAWITHWVKKDRLGAYRAYRQIEQITNSESVKANCRVECIGLMMELAESGKGTHEEVRTEVVRALARIPETDIKHRAIVELINHETWARQPRPDFLKAAELGVQFIEKYQHAEGVDRELATATYQTGMFYRKAGQGNIAKAEEYYQKVLSEFPEDVESFRGFEPHSQALWGLSKVKRSKGDPELAESILDYVVERFPDSRAAVRINESRTPLELRNTGASQ